MGQYHFNESFYADLENKITVKNEPYPHAFIKNFLPDIIFSSPFISIFVDNF